MLGSAKEFAELLAGAGGFAARLDPSHQARRLLRATAGCGLRSELMT